ncbi:hypothetical protein AGMMS49574_02100 [Bacteroidia bacterium]|nr:hypothetical protein AGMMS49574_02100 [Bacteroidia bacterium]
MRRFGFMLSLFLLLSCGMAFAQAFRLDSLLQLLPATKADTNAVLLYMNIGRQYRNAGDLKAAEYYLKAQTLSRKLGYMYGLFESSDGYSIALSRHGLHDSALAVNKEMLILALKQFNAYQAAVEKWNIGARYVSKGFNETALSYFMDALSYFEKENRREEMGDLYKLILVIYSRMDRHEDAIRYGEKALALPNDTLGFAYGRTLSNLSVSYSSLSLPQYEKAMEYLQKALRIAVLNHDSVLESEVFLNIGNIHFRNNRIAESEKYYHKALVFFKEDTHPTGFCIANIGLAKIAMFRNDLAKAEAMALKNLEIARRRGIRLEEKNNLSFLWELSAAKHDWDARLRYKAAFDSVQNLVVNETMLRAAEELEVKYETEKKETQIATLEEEKQLMIWLGIATGAALLLILATFFFLWRWTVQKKCLAESQKELADRQIKQLEQEKQLIATQAVLDGEIQERTRLARDLHDSLGSMLTGARMSIESLKNDALLGKTDIANFDSALKILNDSSHELRRIAHHLMPDALSRFGLKTSVGDFCDALFAVKFLWYGDDTRLNPKTEEMIYRTVHELVNNALKHAHASQIFVQIIQEPNRLAFTVQDDGCGFDPETATEGMGLQNIRTRVASFGGIMNIVSKAGEGTETNIELRITN